MIRRSVAALLLTLALSGGFVVSAPPPPAAASDILCIFSPTLCVAGHIIGSAAHTAVSSLVDNAAKDFGDAAASVIKETFGWWLRTPTVSIQHSGVLKLQGVMLGLAAILGVLVVIAQGIRMVVTRKGAPLAELVQGMLVAGVITTAGVALVDAMLVAGDELAQSLLSVGFSSSDQLVDRMVTVLFGSAVSQFAGLLFVFALVVVLIGLVQAVMLFLRQAAIPLLALVFPIVAIGQLGPGATRRWLPAVGSSVIAIVLYKPLVALILTAGFTQISDGTSLIDVVRGFVTLALSVIALPAMLRIFTPVVGSVAASSGGGAALLGAAGSVATVAALRGHGTPGDTDASAQARFMAGRDSGTGGGGPDGGGSAGEGGNPRPSTPPVAPGGDAAVQSRAMGPSAGSAASATAAGPTSAAAATGVGVPVAVAIKGAEAARAAGSTAAEQMTSGAEN